MIDIVGAEAGAHQLLEEIGLLVGALGGAEAGERFAAMLVADALQARCGAVERLFPAGAAEMRPGIGRIDLVMRVLGDALLADERMHQAMRVMHVVEAEAALDAEPVLVRGPVAAIDIKKLIVLDLIGELAADAAIGADAVDRTVRKRGEDIVCADQRRRHQRAGGTGLHAFAASNASALPHGIVEVEDDLLMMAAAGHADDIVHLHLAAGADAEIALDAGVEIDRHRRVAAVGEWLRALGEAALGDADTIGPAPEARIPDHVRCGAPAGRRPAARRRASATPGRARTRSSLSCRRSASGCRRRRARARLRSRPCRRGNFRPADSPARGCSRDAESPCRGDSPPARSSRRPRPRPRRRRGGT